MIEEYRFELLGGIAFPCRKDSLGAMKKESGIDHRQTMEGYRMKGLCCLAVVFVLVFCFSGVGLGQNVEIEDFVQSLERTLLQALESRDSLNQLILQLESQLEILYASRGRGGERGLLRNVALQKRAYQSSVSTWSGTTGHAGLAVDGNTDGRWVGGSVMHTAFETSPWWEVDLGDVYWIERVSLWNRVEDSARAKNLYILISESPFPEGMSVSSMVAASQIESFHVADVVGRPTDVLVNQKGRYVRVQLVDRSYFHLAEVEVWGY